MQLVSSPRLSTRGPAAIRTSAAQGAGYKNQHYWGFFGGGGAAAQNWRVTADGGLIDYTVILPKLWPAAIGTDEGVQIWFSSRDQKRPKYTVWVTPGPQTELGCGTGSGRRWVEWLMPPYPLLCLGEGDAAP